MSTELEEKLHELGIPFKYQGNDLLVKCTNPNHEDSEPSMRIDQITTMFHCFSCGHKGLFIQGSSSGMHLLARNVLVMKEKIKALRAVRLSKPSNAVAYTADYRAIPNRILQSFDTFTSTENEFKGRLVFPIKDPLGNIVSFLGRAMEADVFPKYKVFPPQASTPPQPAIVPDPKRPVILVEGIFDMLNMHKLGYTNTVCIFGTGTAKSAALLKMLGRYKLQGVTEFIILMDGDKSGQEAAETLQNRLSDNYKVRVAHLAEGEDPGEITKARIQDCLLQSKY